MPESRHAVDAMDRERNEGSRLIVPAARAAGAALLAMLVASIFLNYIDRGNLSVAAPQIESEFALTPQKLGVLFSAFFWTYSLLQLFGVAGWVSDRFSAGIVLGVGLCMWSVATIATGFVTAFVPLFILRLLVGAGESVAYPCYSRILASDFPAERRGFANALIDAGSKLGPALGTLLGGMFLPVLGWRVFFMALGCISLLWLLPWIRVLPRSGPSTTNASAHGPAIIDILRCQRAWGAFFGHFCGNYFWFFLLTWLPEYLVKERHLSMGDMAKISSIAFLAIAIATTIAGWVSDRWITAGGSQTRVRKTMVVGGLACSTVIVPVGIVNNIATSVALLFLACLSFGVYTSNHWAITQTLAGPLAAGRWTSLQNGIGNLSGIAASWVTGAIVEHTHSFPPAFVCAAAFALLGAVLWGTATGPVRMVPWEKHA